MITINLQGGLGNQLFQYSLGRQLALRNHTDLKLEIGWYAAIPDRHYELNKFNIVAQVSNSPKVISKSLPFFRPKKSPNLYTEQSLAFNPSILELGPDTCLEGYFQSEKYFKEIEKQIRQELTLKLPPSGLNAELLQDINNTEAISIHVRRGDYVANKQTNKFHGTCSLDYYQNGLEILLKEVKNPHFYIFSDDPEWTQANLKLDHPTTYITHNGAAAEEDLRLMSHCRHFIIANSSFSWWGAWLSAYAQKKVIAPKQWFATSNPQDTGDLLPTSWQRI